MKLLVRNLNRFLVSGIKTSSRGVMPLDKYGRSIAVRMTV